MPIFRSIRLYIRKVHNNIKKLILNHTACLTSAFQPAYPPFFVYQRMETLKFMTHYQLIQELKMTATVR